jgi:hypothetical protein
MDFLKVRMNEEDCVIPGKFRIKTTEDWKVLTYFNIDEEYIEVEDGSRIPREDAERSEFGRQNKHGVWDDNGSLDSMLAFVAILKLTVEAAEQFKDS